MNQLILIQPILYIAPVLMVMLMVSYAAHADTIDTKGQAAFEACGLCHEYDGNSRMQNFPRLAGQWPDYLKKQLLDYRSGKRKGQMTATAELLSDKQIDIVVRYFSEQKPEQHTPSTIDQSTFTFADNLYRNGDSKRGLVACQDCHGVRAIGYLNSPGLAGQQREYLKNQLLEFKTGQRTNDPVKLMSNVAKKLSDVEIEALSDYLAAMPPLSYKEKGNE